jgi:hypothetical protein
VHLIRVHDDFHGDTTAHLVIDALENLTERPLPKDLHHLEAKRKVVADHNAVIVVAVVEVIPLDFLIDIPDKVNLREAQNLAAL